MISTSTLKMPRSSRSSSKADLASLGAKLVTSTMQQHRSPHSGAGTAAGESHLHSAPPAQPPPPALAVLPTQQVKKVCYDVDPTTAQHLVKFKLGLNLLNVTRKVNDTQVCLFALRQLPEPVTQEIAEEYLKFIESQFPKPSQ